MSAHSKPCLTSLPTEIQLNILSHLTDMNSQTSIYGTCTLWRQMLNRYIMLRAARYYRGRAPYIYFPVVHRFFDISPRGNGRCQVKGGEIVGYQYRTDAFGYMDVSDMVKNDMMFSPVCGSGWWAPSRQGTTVIRRFTQFQSVKPGDEVEINHSGNTEELDAEGELSTTPSNALAAVDIETRNTMDAVWFHIQIGYDFQRDKGDPISSVWERILLPKGSTIETWTNAVLEAAKSSLRQKGKPIALDFYLEFREAFVSGSKPAQGWYVEVWVILSENLEERLARLQLRDNGIVLVAVL
ncbi:hypothetical protein TWF481_006516 [Arthrobotrys musiformis]|uniref:F-box domain-containing protein n=1 Tax=Arthrobotrys musiformis TaxID=47236 RepID=A0AAV9W8Q2_9PEZI